MNLFKAIFSDQFVFFVSVVISLRAKMLVVGYFIASLIFSFLEIFSISVFALYFAQNFLGLETKGIDFESYLQIESPYAFASLLFIRMTSYLVVAFSLSYFTNIFVSRLREKVFGSFLSKRTQVIDQIDSLQTAILSACGTIGTCYFQNVCRILGDVTFLMLTLVFLFDDFSIFLLFFIGLFVFKSVFKKLLDGWVIKYKAIEARQTELLFRQVRQSVLGIREIVLGGALSKVNDAFKIISRRLAVTVAKLSLTVAVPRALIEFLVLGSLLALATFAESAAWSRLGFSGISESDIILLLAFILRAVPVLSSINSALRETAGSKDAFDRVRSFIGC